MSEVSLLYRKIFRAPTSAAPMAFTDSVGLCVEHDALMLRSVPGLTAQPRHYPRRRVLLYRDAPRRHLPPPILFDGGYGILFQNPIISLVALMGCFGLYCFIRNWVMVLCLKPNVLLLTLLGCFGLLIFLWIWVLAVILIPNVIVEIALDFGGLFCGLNSWVLELYLRMVFSLGVVLVIVISRIYSVYSHLVLMAFDLDFILTSLPIFHSSVRESPISMPLFKRAIFPDWIISDQRLYSLLEKIQTAYKRTFVEILKAVLLWSTFEECAMTCINHLDPIEEHISMRFEDLSLCFSLCIFKRLTFLLSILWFEDAIKMYCAYVTGSN